VLGGGGARGAYEVGVLRYLREELGPELGCDLPLDILCGSSVGALHACYLAATAGKPGSQSRPLAEAWRRLRVDRVLRLQARDILGLARSLARRPRPGSRRLREALVDPTGLRSLVVRLLPWQSIAANIRAGHLAALSITATHVGTGTPVVWVQAPTGIEFAGAARARIGPRHALASAAIPLLFPPVELEGELFVDGSLRMGVPIAPAVRLGADRILAISLRDRRPPAPLSPTLRQQKRIYATAPFLLGKTLDALLLDRMEQDLDRLAQINALIEAGTAAYGPRFSSEISRRLPAGMQSRLIREMVLRPSEDLGHIAADHVRSPRFGKRNRGLATRLIRWLAEREAPQEADLTSYLLFDGDYADSLIDLGLSDARARRDQWLRFFAPEAAGRVAQRRCS
jgi:NTE family protein